MITSTMTAKAKTTIPQAVREALNLKPGDELAYQIEDGRVVLMRADVASGSDDRFATFSEWCSEADKKAYASL